MNSMTQIFIADDEKIIRESIRDCIDWESIGFQVVGTGSNGRDVLNFFADYNFDILISDIRMPEMNGLELLEALAEMDSAIRVVLISAYSSFDYVHKAIQHSIVSDYLLKPINPDDLITAVQKAASQICQSNRQPLIKELSPAEALEYRNPYLQEAKKEFISRVRSLEYHPAQSIYRNCISTIQEKHLSLNLAKHFTLELISLLNDMLYARNLTIDAAFSMSDVLYELMVASNFRDLTDLISAVLKKICTYLETEKQREFSPLIQAALEIMKKKYRQYDFSLQTLSDDLGVANTYLSSKFKKNTGTNFSRMLNLMRMERAKEMLADPNCHVSEIAANCGISDIRYFTRLFKNHTGQTPKEYRAFILYGRVMSCPAVTRLLLKEQKKDDDSNL